MRDNLLGIPSDIGSLERNYVLADEDLALVATRRRPRIGSDWRSTSRCCATPAKAGSTGSNPRRHWSPGWPSRSTCRARRWPAMPPEDQRAPSTGEWQSATSVCASSCGPSTCARAILLAARAAFDTDDGGAILRRLTTELKTQRFVLPSAVTLERIGLAGRARARRVAAQALNDALDARHKRALVELLEHDPGLGRSRLTWLRTLPHSTSAASMQGLLQRLKHVRTLGLPRDFGEAIHPTRLGKFPREGAVAL